MEEKKLSEEEVFERKQKAKTRGRIVLIVLNLLLLCCLLFELTSFIISLFKDKNDKNEQITLCNQTSQKSKEYFEQYSSSYDVNYYGTYGNYLHLSKKRMAAASYSELQSLKVHNICNDKITDYNMDLNSSKLNGGIDLFSFDYGEYFLLSDNKPLRIKSSKLVSDTFYSLPGEDGARKKVEYLSSSYYSGLVIKVSKTFDLPNGYYDYIIYAKEEIDKNAIINNNPYIRSAIVTEADYVNGLPLVKKMKTNYVIDLENVNSIVISNYIATTDEELTKSEVYDTNDEMNKYDKSVVIRELGGTINGASKCNSDYPTSCIIFESYRDEYMSGKFVYVTKLENINKVIGKIK